MSPSARGEVALPGRIRFLRRLGHRGAVLALFSLLCLAYGSGLVAGYQPTFSGAFRVPDSVFGWVFIGVGLLVFTGVPSRADAVPRDAVQHAVAEGAAVAWALLLSTHFRTPEGWTAGMSWGFIALGLLVSSAWPNAPRRPAEIRLPPLPSLEELVTLPGEGQPP